ncbi:MAG: 39S ribosomal protein L45 [Deltaproteobacteria bacterium]|nr:39S ribosomal protein L45 [Deltaproteobacteria bacterium]
MKGWRRAFAVVVIGAPVALGFGSVSSASHGDARPGGGSSFSGGGGGGFSGGSSFGGGSSFSSSGGGGGDIGGFGLGIVLVLGALFAMIGHHNKADDSEGWSSGDGFGNDFDNDFATLWESAEPKPMPVMLEPLRQHDAHFSQILLEDFLYELYIRAQEARGSKQELALLSPYLDDSVRAKLLDRGGRHPLAVSTVIVGAMRIAKFELADDWASIRVDYETNYTESYPSGDGRGRLGFYSKERWHFVRRISVHSRKPDETRGFNCASCGAPVEQDQHAECSHCGQTHGSGEFDWVCNGVVVKREETRGPALTGYAEEQGTFDATVIDPFLDRDLAALGQHDPAFDRDGLFARVKMIYHQLNTAWSSLEWEQARPFLSDRLWSSMHYWIRAYEEQDLQNLMIRAKIDRIVVAKVRTDPFFHAVTVRIWASALDHTVHRGSGAVVGGNDSAPRDYSEYWTFIRSAERRGEASTDSSCPNCGAGLELNMAGNCKYCEVKITAGQFDWVLSAIEQDEAYLG